MKKEIRFALCLVILALTFGIVGYTSADFEGPYEMQNWGSSGIPEGTTSITPSSGPTASAEFGYYVFLGYPAGGVGYRTATFYTTAAYTGSISFDWEYYFFHAWFDVYADLYVFADGPSGTTTIHLVDFYNWGYTGPQTFTGSSTIWVESGYNFGFIVGGSNYDSNSILQGTLTINNFIMPIMPVSIDIKPGHPPNPINVKSKGVLPVGIVGSDTLNVNDIDITTITLEGPGGEIDLITDKWSVEDVTSPVSGELDGYDDLTIFFYNQDVIGILGDVNDGDTVTLKIKGKLLNGVSIEGEDVALIIKKP